MKYQELVALSNNFIVEYDMFVTGTYGTVSTVQFFQYDNELPW